MRTIERMSACFHEEIRNYILSNIRSIREIHIRAGRPVQIISYENKLFKETVTIDEFGKILRILTDFSLYSRENEFIEGFFTIEDGCRVGICGKMNCENGKITNLVHSGSLCIRFAREVKGCASELIPVIRGESYIRSVLVFSPPGMGKTTILRDIARILSDEGICIGIADERHEIAACKYGIPTLDVGKCTDVMDGCPKATAINMLIRSMAPSAVITDEIGDERDAKALSEARRCGVAVIASAHAGNFDDLTERRNLSGIFEKGVFEYAVKLGEKPGSIAEIRSVICKPEGGFKWGSV